MASQEATGLAFERVSRESKPSRFDMFFSAHRLTNVRRLVSFFLRNSIVDYCNGDIEAEVFLFLLGRFWNLFRMLLERWYI